MPSTNVLPQEVSDALEVWLAHHDDTAPGLITGLYVVGSTALSDWQTTSDIDIVALMDAVPSPEQVEQLRQASDGARDALAGRCVDGPRLVWSDLAHEPQPLIRAWTLDGQFHYDDACFELNPVVWFTLASYGIAVRGPAVADVVIHTDANDRVAFVSDNTRTYWRSVATQIAAAANDPARMEFSSEMTSWSVLGVARMLYTARTGDVTSKSGAGTWIAAVLPQHRELVDHALEVRRAALVGSDTREVAAATVVYMEEVIGLINAVETPLAGGWQTDVRRRGEVVLRSSGPQSPTAIGLLEHLSERGFDAAPRPVGGGFAPDGREQLTYVEGRSRQPLAWSDDAVWKIGSLVRDLHTATADFDPGPDAVWRPWFARDLGASPKVTSPKVIGPKVIGHCDLGPWNILAVDEMPVSFIDWDNAGPIDPIWELAQVAWLNAQLHDDDVAELNDLPEAPARLRQCALILDGYGLSSADRDGFVDKMIEFALRSARDEAITHHVTVDTPSPAPDGFPTLWGVTWRARAACWMLDHRAELVRSIT